ncbi:MAG TPA: TolC family protein [Gemmatimonadaceae bacterium]|nr:TolC family protein [Gemmatimonadaceae bacterium]
MKKTLVVLAALVAPTIVVAQDQARPISLTDAVTMAKKNSPSMVQARGQLRTSSMSVRVARWAFSPLNNIAFNYGSNLGGGGIYTSDGVFQQRNPTSWGFSQSFGNATLVIWDGGKRFSDLKRAHAQVDQAEANETLQQFTITANVKQQYYAILQARESEAAAQAQIAQAEQQFKSAVARVKAGTAIASDTNTQLVQLGNARLAQLNARASASNASAQLTRLTGSDAAVTAIDADTADPPRLLMNDLELMQLAEQGPSVQNSIASLNAQKASERSTRSVLWPTVQATGSYGRSNSQATHGGFSGYDFGSGPMNYNWSFGLSLNWQLWNGYSRESQLLNARVQTDNSEANLRDVKLQARQNIVQQINTLRTAEANLAIAHDNVTNAAEALRIAQTRYDVGAGDILTVLTAQNTLNQQRTTLIQQRFTLRNTRAQIETLIGRELPQQ